MIQDLKNALIANRAGLEAKYYVRGALDPEYATEQAHRGTLGTAVRSILPQGMG